MCSLSTDHGLFLSVLCPFRFRRRLATYLPLPVDETKGVAKWDAGNETLSVTLPIVEEEEW